MYVDHDLKNAFALFGADDASAIERRRNPEGGGGGGFAGNIFAIFTFLQQTITTTNMQEQHQSTLPPTHPLFNPPIND